jgi:hypothetical protein
MIVDRNPRFSRPVPPRGLAPDMARNVSGGSVAGPELSGGTAVMGISSQAVSSHLARGMCAMQALLGRD